jgi:hypothetical protein
MSSPRPRHVQVSNSSNGQIPLGAIKGSPHLSFQVDHSFHLANILRHSLELQISLPQVSFRSKLPRRDLSLTLE